MRSMTLRLALPLLVALAAAGCKQEGTEGPLAACRPVSAPCGLDSDCCSYGCRFGSCVANPLEGGICRTSDDCSGRVCVDQRCTSAVSCLNPPDTCDARIPCCSGICNAGICKADAAPIAVAGPDLATRPPFRIPIQLTNASYDPDTSSSAGLSYLWTVVSAPAGSTATFAPSSSYPTPTFTPDVADAGTPYVLRLRASNAGGAGEDTVTFYAVNTPPAVQMPADVAAPAYQSRNVPLTFSATVSDADGGPVTCTWSKTSPSSVTTEVSGPTACAGASGTAATGLSTFTLDEDEAGTWRLTLTATDGVNPPGVADRFVNVQNDPPVASAGPKRWGNYDLGGIPLAGTATDPNGDVLNGNQGDATFTWEWRVTAAPAGSGQLGAVVGTTPAVSFTPDAEGLYTLTLTADDGHGGPSGDSDAASVDVQVEPFVLPLGEVVDAEYVEGASPERLVLVQTDAANAHKLTVVDPVDLTVTAEVALAARPTALALNFTAPAQSEALVAEAGGIFQRITGIQSTPVIASTVPAGSALPADLVDVVHAGAYAYGLTAGGTVYLLDPDGSTGWWSPVSCPTCTTVPIGTRAAGAMTLVGATSTPTIWLMQGGAPGGLGRYHVHSNGNLQDQVTNPAGTFAGATGVWISQDATDVYTTRTSVWDALSSTLAQRVTTPLQVAPDHVDSTVASGMLAGAIAQYGSPSLQPFSRTTPGGAFTFSTIKAYPFLGVNGNQVTNYGRFAFVRSGGGAYYAIVRANVGTATAPVWRWGAANLGP